MRRILFFLLLLTYVFKAESQDITWHNTIGGTGNITPLKSLIDQNNNIYIIGSFDGNIKYTGIINASSAGSTDGFLAKFKASGALAWIKTFGGIGVDEVRAIAIDPSSQNILVGGSFQYTSSFTGGPTLTVQGTVDASNVDAFIAEYDTSGNYQSVIRFATGSKTKNTIQTIESMKVDNTGKIFACGYYRDSIYFNSGSLAGSTTNYNYIGRFNRNGSPIWATKVAGTVNSNRALLVDITNEAAYWAGQYSSTMSFSTLSMTNTSGLRNMFILKTDLNGLEDTYREVKGSGEEITSSLSISDDGVFLGGYFNTSSGGLSIDSTGTLVSSITPKPNSLGGYDFIYLKYLKNLNLSWYHVAGSTGSSTANDDYLLRALNAKGLFVVAGKFGGNIDFVPGTTLTYGGGTGTDMFGLVMDQFNNYVYAIPFAGTNIDVGRTAAIDNLGNYFFIGDFKSTDFKVSGSSITLEGGSDLIIAKYRKGSLDKYSTNITCKGNANGTISVAPRGPLTPPYTYTWDKAGVPFTPADPQYLTDLTPDTYNLHFSDSEGFTIDEVFTITEPAADIEVSVLSQTDVNCFGEATGSVTLSGFGGTSPYTFNKDGGAYQTSTIFSGLRAATYQFGVKGANGCTAFINVTITEPASALTVILTGTATTGNDGTATATPAGGTSPYSYSWDTTPIQTDFQATDLSAGTFTVIVTDSKTCQTSGSIGITLLVGSIVKTDITCFGDNNGTATVSVTGGLAPYSFELFNDGVSQGAPNLTGIFTGLTPSDKYSITVTDATPTTPNTTSTSFTIIEPAMLTATLNKTDITCIGYQDGSIETTITGGTAPYTYAWTKNASSFESTANIFNLEKATYELTVTDKNSCQDIKSSTLSTTQSNLIVSLTATNANCYLNQGNISGSIVSSVSGNNGSPSYLWNNGITTSGITANPGNYYLTVTDGLGCTATATQTISYGPQISGNIDVIVTPCFGSSTGSIKFTPTLSGNGGLTYLWNTLETTQTISDLPEGGYSITVVDSKNCQYQSSTTLASYALPTASFSGTTTICAGESTILSITLTGSAPWNVTYDANGTPTVINGINTSPYSFSVTPTNNTTYTITEVYSVAAVSDLHCNGIDFGSSATVIVNPHPTSAISGSVTICNGSSTDLSIDLTGTQPWSLTYTDGTTPVTVSGITTSPYTLSVSPNTSTTYTVTELSDANCTSIAADMTGSATVTVNPRPTSAISGSATICNGSSTDLSIDLTGTQPWSLTYTDGTTPVIVSGITTSPYTFSISPSTSTSYTVTVLSDANCSSIAGDITGIATVTFYPLPIPMVSGLSTVCANSVGDIYTTETDMTGYIWSVTGGSITAGGGTADNSVTIDWGASDPGLVSVNYTDANGCKASSATNHSVTINALPIVSVNTTGKTSYCQGESINTQLTVLPSGATSYQWQQNSSDINGETNDTYTAISSGIFSVIAFNAEGCSSAGSLEIVVNALPVIDIAPGVDTIKIKTNEQHTFDAGTGFASYLWNNGTSDQTLAVDGAAFNPGNYTFWAEVTNTSGCVTRDTAILNVSWPTAINTEKDWSVSIFPNPASGEFKLNITGVRAEKVEIIILNSTGMIIYKKEYQTNNGELHEPINLNMVSKGVYLIKINDKKLIVTKKIILE